MRTITDQLLAAMPAPDASNLTREAFLYVHAITRLDGRLYASKPRNMSPKARYIWRMVVHAVSPRPQHQCMPVTAHFELGPYSKVKDLLGELDAIADQIVDAIPVQQWHGVARWASILA